MLKYFFRKPKPSRDVDSLIKDIADHQRDKDYSELFTRLPTLRLFLPLAAPLPPDLPPGKALEVGPELTVQCRTTSVQGMDCVLTFTSATHPELGPHYAEIEGHEALAMVLKTSVSGLLIQSSGTGWIGLDKKKIAHVLASSVMRR